MPTGWLILKSDLLIYYLGKRISRKHTYPLTHRVNRQNIHLQSGNHPAGVSNSELRARSADYFDFSGPRGRRHSGPKCWWHAIRNAKLTWQWTASQNPSNSKTRAASYSTTINHHQPSSVHHIINHQWCKPNGAGDVSSCHPREATDCLGQWRKACRSPSAPVATVGWGHLGDWHDTGSENGWKMVVFCCGWGWGDMLWYVEICWDMSRYVEICWDPTMFKKKPNRRPKHTITIQQMIRFPASLLRNSFTLRLIVLRTWAMKSGQKFITWTW